MTFKTQLLADLNDIFLNPDEFASAITYTPTGGSAKTIYGIFDADYSEFSPLDGEVATSEPSVLCKTSDVAAIKTNEPVVIDGVTYRINGPGEPDGTGLTRVRLVR